MDKRVEAAARAMYGNPGDEFGPWESQYRETQDLYRDGARVVLEAADAADDHVRIPRSTLQEWAALAEPLVAEHIHTYLEVTR